jgi:hypothetical protein
MLTIHPLAEIFPPIDDDGFAELVADIRENGLREPIILHEGKVLDGRNRYRACAEIGIEPLTKQWDGRGDPLDYVVSKNLHRRHLDDTQRALVAARISTLKRGGNGSNQHARAKVPNGTFAPSIDQSADMMNVGRRSVLRARAVLTSGVHALQRAVESGDISLRAASEVVTKPHEEQMQFVAAHKSKSGRRYNVRLPEGMTPEQAGRMGLRVERDNPDMSIAEVADKIGMDQSSYRKTREIVMLLDRDDLTAADMATIKAAVNDMNETNRIMKASEAVAGVAERFFGSGSKVRRTDAKIAERAERFETQVAIVWRACVATDEIEVPHISADRATHLGSQIKNARAALARFENRIRRLQP